MTARIAVLHAPGAAVGLRELVTGAAGLAEVVLLLRRRVAEQEPRLAALAGSLFEVAVVDDERLVTEVAARRIDGITTFHDGELEHADAIATALGLPGAPELDRPWDKLVQRRAWARAGVTGVRAAPVDSPAALVRAAGELGWPVVLKPRRGTGSVGVCVLDGPADVAGQEQRREGWDGLLAESMIARDTHPSGVPWLADYVSVETWSTGDRHHHFAVFDKIPIATASPGGSPVAYTLRETGDVLPSRLPEPVLAEVLDRTSRALDALGVRFRCSHTELRVGAAGVELIEVNGRLGGEVARLLRMAGGPDVVRAALGVALGRAPDLPAGPEDHGFVACLYVPFPDRSGKVRSDVSRADLRALPGVVAVDEAAAFGDARDRSGFRAAKVTLRAGGAGELDHLLAGVLAGIARLYSADGLASDGWVGDLLTKLPATSKGAVR